MEPTSPLIPRTKPGQTGVDVEVLGKGSEITGFKYGEIKPKNLSQTKKYESQIERWGLQPDEVQAITYDEFGNIYRGF